MKKLLWLVPAALIILVAGALIAPSFIDWNKYKPQIISAVKIASGYDVAIDGALSLKILPAPRLSVEGLRVSLPGQNDPIVTLGRAEIAVSLTDLFHKAITVERVALIDPVVVLATDAAGRPLWLSSALSEAKTKGVVSEASLKEASIDAVGAQAALAGLVLSALQVEGGSLSYRDGRRGALYKIDDIDVTLKAKSVMGPYDLAGELSYLKDRIRLDVALGAIDPEAGNVSVNAAVSVPSRKVNMRYAGIVGYGASIGAQGEVGLKLDDVALLASQVRGGALASQSLTLSGLMTLKSADEVSLKNASLSLGATKFSGDLSVKGLSKKVPDIAVSLATEDVLDVDQMMPAAMSGKAKVGGGASGAKQGGVPKPFLPETLTLPMDVSGKLDVKMAGLRYQGQTFKSPALHLERKEGVLKGQLSSELPGGGSFKASPVLQFQSSSVSQKDGAITLSDPVLTVEGTLQSQKPDVLARVAMDFSQLATQEDFWALPLSADVKVRVTPRKMELSAGRIVRGSDSVSVSGGYGQAVSGGRDKATILLEGEKLDLVALMGGVDPAQKGAKDKSADSVSAKANDSAVSSLKTQLAKIKLPFDLTVSAQMRQSVLPQIGRADVQVKGGLSGDRLQIEALDVKTPDNDHLALAGHIGQLSALTGIDLRASGETPNLEKLLTRLNLDKNNPAARVGEASLVSAVKGDSDRLDFTVNVKALRGTIEAAGAVSALLDQKTPQLDEMTLRVRNPSYPDLVRLWNPAFSSAVTIRKDLDVYAQVKRLDNIYDISGVKAQIGPTSVQGTVKADMGAARPAYSAQLQLGDVPLSDLLGVESAKKGVVRASGSGGASKNAAQKSTPRWSKEPFALDGLRAFDLDLTATAQSLSYGDWAASAVDAALKLRDGTLTIDKLNGQIYGGQMAVAGQAVAGQAPDNALALAGQVTLDDVALESFVKAFSGERLVKARGAISLKSAVKAKGDSVAALVGDLNGFGSSAGHDLVMEGFDLARLSRALAAPTSSFTENFTKVLDATMAGGSTSFDTLDMAYNMKDGVITFDKLALDGADALVTATGDVNLPRWTIDLETVVDLKEPEDAPSLETAFKGPLDNPGKTFGQSAMQQYVRKQLEGLIVNPLIERLQKKGVLSAPASSSSSSESSTSDATTQTPSSSQQQKTITPEDALFGVLQGVLGGQ